MPKSKELQAREDAFQKHIKNDFPDGSNPDGCFYCGGDHPSDCCASPDRNEYWEINGDSE